MIALYLLTGVIAQPGTIVEPPPPPVTIDGDAGGGRRSSKRPIIHYVPKAEQQLEEALDELQDVRPKARVSENKKKVRKALAIVREIAPPPTYAPAIAAIERGLKEVARATAQHQGMTEALLAIATDMQQALAAMEAQRRRRAKDEEAIAWLI